MINESYLDSGALIQIMHTYAANQPRSVQLQQFLLPEVYAPLAKAIHALRSHEETIADKYSRRVATLPAVVEKKILSGELCSFIKKITGKKPKSARIEHYGHRHYTIRNDEEKPPGLVAYFDFSSNWDTNFGGSFIVTDSQGELARVPPLHNTLVLIDCSNAYPFTQYVNHHANAHKVTRLVLSF